MILLPSNRQPVGPLRIDRSNSLTDGLAGLFLPHLSRDIISSGTASTNTAPQRMGPGGWASDYSGTVSTQFAHKSQYATTGACTIVALLDVDTLTNYGAIIAKQGSSTTNCPYELRLGGAATDSFIHVVRAMGTDYRAYNTNANRLSAGQQQVLIGVTFVDGTVTTVPTFYVNGVPITGVAAGGSGTGAVTDNASNVWIGRRSDGATQFDGCLYYVGVFGRAWSDEDHFKLHTNRWQLFERRRFFVKAPAAGTNATVTLDAAIQQAKSATATLNAVIQTSGSSTATLDGVIQQSRSTTATLDGAIQAAVSATVTLNAAIQAAMSGTSTMDAVITTGAATTLTATLDAAIQQAKSLTATLDAVIQTSGSASATLNAVIAQSNSATATLDATILAAVTAFALLDAYIFDADAPVVETTPVAVAGRGRRRRYIMPDDSVVIATPSEAEQLVKLFVKPVPPKKPPKKAVKALKKIDLVEIEEVSSDTVPTEKITVKKKAVWEQSDLYNQAIKLLAEREILRRRREEEMILLAA